jgi:Cof subfamily protein (haloacid dehalogenase superfamily)
VVEYEARNNGYLLREHVDLAADIDWAPNKIMTVGVPSYLQEHHAEIAAPFEGELSAMFTAPFYFEFTPLGVDKAHSMELALERLGIDRSEVAAFGDAENDTSMIAFAGHGVAMGNAVEATKAAAEFVTADNDHDGIADALARLMPDLF